MLTLIDTALLDELCVEAANSPRRRMNRNFHPNNEYPGHRLLNAMCADSYIPPHRHCNPHKDETFVVLRGVLGLVLFDEMGALVQAVKVGAGETALGVDIPHNEWHSVVALTPHAVFLEAKSGPYSPLTETERASWAPAENSPEAAAYLARTLALFRV